MWKLLLWPALLGLCGNPAARAQIPEPTFQTAQTVIRQYARDLSEIAPCAFSTMNGPADEQRFNDAYGPLMVEEVLQRMLNLDGSAEQARRLMAIFVQDYRPNWHFPDIRRIAERCYPVPDDIAMMSGRAQPIYLRPPFNGSWR